MRERIKGLLQEGLPVPDALAVVLRDLRIDPKQQLVNVIRMALNSRNAQGKRPSQDSVVAEIRHITAVAIEEPMEDLAELLVTVSQASGTGDP